MPCKPPPVLPLITEPLRSRRVGNFQIRMEGERVTVQIDADFSFGYERGGNFDIVRQNDRLVYGVLPGKMIGKSIVVGREYIIGGGAAISAVASARSVKPPFWAISSYSAEVSPE